MIYYTVYKVTNKINGKIYVGCHKTSDLNDGYMGSGKYLKRSINKHGIENFDKEILFIFDNPEEMFTKESAIVNEEFVAEENTYNLKIGGHGGWDHYNGTDAHKEHINKHNKAIASSGGKAAQRNIDHAERKRRGALAALKMKGQEGYFKGKKHTEETKAKISEITKVTQQGSRNSQYGTMWIYSDEEKQSMKIDKNTPIPEGWKKGRKIKF